jgi:hypothetical protein
MRLLKLVLPIAAAATSATLAAAVASADEHPSPGGRCNVSVNVAPREITAGDSVIVWGQLRCRGHGGRSAANQVVKVLERGVGSPSFTVVASTSTDARGFYEATVANVQVNSVFLVRSHEAASGRRTVRVAAEVTLSGPPPKGPSC